MSVYEIREGSTPARLELYLDGDHVGGATAHGMGGMLVNAGKVAVTEAQEAIGRYVIAARRVRRRRTDASRDVLDLTDAEVTAAIASPSMDDDLRESLRGSFSDDRNFLGAYCYTHLTRFGEIWNWA